MQAIYHTDVNELNIDFLNMLKKQFLNAKVDIVIKDIDETDYLNSSSENRKLLDEAILEVEQSKLIHKEMDELNIWSYLLLKKVGKTISLAKRKQKDLYTNSTTDQRNNQGSFFWHRQTRTFKKQSKRLLV